MQDETGRRRTPSGRTSRAPQSGGLRKFEKAGFNSERAWLASAWLVSEASAYTGLTLTNELSQVCPRLIVLGSQ